MNDRQKWEFAGCPETCKQCGAPLHIGDFDKVVQVYCTKELSHEFYRWNREDPGMWPGPLFVIPKWLPGKLRPVLYVSLVWLLILGLTFAAMKVFGG